MANIKKIKQKRYVLGKKYIIYGTGNRASIVKYNGYAMFNGHRTLMFTLMKAKSLREIKV